MQAGVARLCAAGINWQGIRVLRLVNYWRLILRLEGGSGGVDVDLVSGILRGLLVRGNDGLVDSFDLRFAELVESRRRV